MMRPFLRFLICFSLILGWTTWRLPLQSGVRYPRTPGPDFDPAMRLDYRDHINELRPRIVLMGDSTLQDSVDIEALARLMGEPVYGIPMVASASAMWYAVLKNNILEAEVKPGVLVLFYRSTLLTTPDYRVYGRYFTLLDELAGADEDLLVERSYLLPMGPLARLAERWLPLFGERQSVRQRIDARLQGLLPEWLLGYGEGCLQQSIRDVYSADLDMDDFNIQIKIAESYLLEGTNLFFPWQVNRSYLPEYVRLSHENGIRLVLVETKTLGGTGGATTDLLLRLYERDLRAWLARNDVPLLSYAGDERLPPALFRDPIHLNAGGREVFTGILAADLAALQQ